jgi:hypothetical protein
MAEERTITSIEELERLLAEMDEDLAEMDNYVSELAEEFVLEENSVDDFLHWKEEYLRDEKARKERVKVGGGYFLVLASYGKQEFEWWDYYACQKAAEDDVQIRVNRMREYDHTPLQADKLEWVVEPY